MAWMSLSLYPIPFRVLISSLSQSSLMKSFTQFLLLALASFAIVKARTVTQDTPPACAASTKADFDSYKTHVEMIRDTSGDNRAIRLFNTFYLPAGNIPTLQAMFFYESGHMRQSPSGTIINSGVNKVILEVDLNKGGPKPETMYLTIGAGQTCKTGLPNEYYPFDIRKVTAATNEK
jgi:hypothetical protein